MSVHWYLYKYRLCTGIVVSACSFSVLTGALIAATSTFYTQGNLGTQRLIELFRVTGQVVETDTHLIWFQSLFLQDHTI